MLNVFGVQLNAHYTVTLPVSLGTLWSYLYTVKDVYKHLNHTGWAVYHAPETSVMDLFPEVDKNGPPDVVLVSLYMWNRNRSIKLTKAIKQKYPNVKIIVGGNEVPQDPERFKQFVADNPQFDYYVNSEGEVALEMMLRKILSEKGIYESTYYEDCYHQTENGKIISKQKTRRYLNHKAELDYPSACALGLYDDLVASLPKGIQIQGVLETNRGCPYTCTFCDWGLEEKLRRFSMKRIKDEIDWYVGNVNEIMFSDANFGILHRDLDIAKYLIKAKLKHPNPKLHTTAITYAKNNKERVLRIAEILEKFDFSRSGATFSLQSLHTPTLQAIKRDNLSITKDFEWIATNFIQKGLPYYHEMIMGMPLETKESFLNGMSKLLKYNPLEINVYKLAWLENSEISLDKHEDIYKLKWDEFEQGPSPYEDEKEYAYIIGSTSTITRNDMKYIRDIRDLIQVLWLGRTIFYVGRYLQNEFNIEACDMLEKIVDWFKTKGDTEFYNTLILSKEDAVRDKKHDVPLWFPYQKDKYKFHRYSNAWLYIHGTKERKNYFYDQITQFFLDTYKNVDKDILLDLIHFNKNILIDGEQTEFKTNFESKYSWIEYFTNGELVKLKTTYDAKIEVAGNTKVSKDTVDRNVFLYYIAGGHEFMFNKQNAFYYPEGTYTNSKGENHYISRIGMFYPADTYFESAEDIIDSILDEDDIDIKDYSDSASARLKISKNINEELNPFKVSA